MKNTLITFLQDKHIDFEEVKLEPGNFPPGDEFWIKNGFTRCKNLFFRDNHGKNHFLVIFDYYKKPDIKKLSVLVGRGSLTLASGWRLEKYLKLIPGYISVFGIMNDVERQVKIVLDENLKENRKLSFLPNTAGVSFITLSFNELVRFIEARGNELIIAKLE